MADVSEKITLSLLGALDGLGQVIEGMSKIADFLRAFDRRLMLIVPASDGFGSSGGPAQRSRDGVTDQQGENHRKNQADERSLDERTEQILAKIAEDRGAGTRNSNNE